MARSSSRLLAGLILFVVGAAGFAYGLISYNAAHASLQGKLNSLGNSVANALTGGTSRGLFSGFTDNERTAVIFMIIGGAVGVIGLVLLLVRGRRR